MKQVWLVYEYDYGGTFSLYHLRKVFEDYDDAKYYADTLSLSTSIIQASYAGTLDIFAYPCYLGGLFQD